MSARDVLDKYRARGFLLRAHGEMLQIRHAQRGMLDPAARHELLQHKPALLAMLRGEAVRQMAEALGLDPLHRFVILHADWPMQTCETLRDVLLWLWGRELVADPPTGTWKYTVLDGVRFIPCDAADLGVWSARYWPAQKGEG